MLNSKKLLETDKHGISKKKDLVWEPNASSELKLKIFVMTHCSHGGHR